MRWMILPLLWATVACNAASPPPPKAVVSAVGSPRTDFARYRTFSFAPANPPTAGYETTSRSLEVQRRIAPLVEASLLKRGYERAAENSDLLIKISAGSGFTTSVTDERGDPPIQVDTGFIGIDAYERGTGASVWHGTAFADINPERIDDQLLARGVEHMLTDFPVSQASLRTVAR